MTKTDVDVETDMMRRVTLEGEVKTRQSVITSDLNVIPDVRGITLRRTESMMPTVTISNMLAMIHQATTTTHTINISNTTRLFAAPIHKRITNGTQNTTQ